MASIYDKSSLVLIPSGTKTGKVFSQKPVSGDGDFTFTRASAATRVNADGNIEKETINLFRYSEEFNQGSAWSKQGGAQISPNASTAPDGTNTADLLYPSISGVVKAAIQSFTSASGTQYAQSIYVKASGKNFAALYALNGSAGPAMWVNLTTGAITNGSTPNVVGRFATSVGDGWWRIGFADLGNGTIGYMHIYPTDTAGSQNVTANGTDGILIWGGQLNYGSVAQEYIKTTTSAVYGGITDNTPRLDYTDSSCPALLLEPQRTNVFPHSEYFSSWQVFRGSVTANSITSPEGVVNAYRYEENADTGQHFVRYQGVSMTSGTDYTASVFAKAGEITSVILGSNSPSLWNPSATTFNLSTGEVTSGGGTIEPMGNDWYRCIISGECLTTTSSTGLEITTSSGAGSTGDGLYIYGAQLEQGSYATSYIPTYGSSVTRIVDATSKTGISDLIGQTEGTLFVEFEYNSTKDHYWPIATLMGSTAAELIEIYGGPNSNSMAVVMLDNSTSQFSVNTPLSVGTHKVAIAYAENNTAAYLDGSLIGSVDTSCTIPTLTQMAIGKFSYSSSYAFGDNIKQALLFKTRLSNEELAALTTI